MDKLNNAISDLAGNLADAEAEAKALHDYIEAAKEQGLTEINRFDYFVSFRLMLHESTQALERFRLENPHLMPVECEYKSQWCEPKNDVKLCQMKSQSRPYNVYKGQVFNICKECRKALNGSFKIVKKP